MLKMLRLVKNQEKGFTLVELIIAMVIVAVLGIAIVMTYTQIIGSNSGVTNRQNAVKQVQYAVESLSRDAQQASTISWASPTLTLTIPVPVTTGSSFTTSTITVKYTYTNNTLQRQVIGSNTTIVATNITSFVPPSSYSGGIYTLTLTATVPPPPKVGGAVETRTIQIIPRPQS